jgi:8-oxo-dGTP diphosphatase
MPEAPRETRSTPWHLVVGAAVVDDLEAPRRLLAARRSEPPALAGRWEFPGGKVERGEAPEAALRREIREELGVEIDVGREIVGPDEFGVGWHGERIGPAWRLGESPVDGTRYVLRLWLVTIASGEPRTLEGHDELRWLGPGEWRDVPWVDGDAPIVDALIDEAVRLHRSGWC